MSGKILSRLISEAQINRLFISASEYQREEDSFVNRNRSNEMRREI